MFGPRSGKTRNTETVSKDGAENWRKKLYRTYSYGSWEWESNGSDLGSYPGM